MNRVKKQRLLQYGLCTIPMIGLALMMVSNKPSDVSKSNEIESSRIVEESSYSVDLANLQHTFLTLPVGTEETEVETTKDKEQEKLQKIAEFQTKFNELDKSNNLVWFKSYKILVGDYKQYLEPITTIYDRFSSDELWLLFQIVEAEVTGENNFDSKCNVASVIYNRLWSEHFPNDVISILTSPQQFSSYWDKRYLQVQVTETTRLACEYAFEIGDTTNCALYFDGCGNNSWALASGLTYLFTDQVGHSFYR